MLKMWGGFMIFLKNCCLLDIDEDETFNYPNVYENIMTNEVYDFLMCEGYELNLVYCGDISYSICYNEKDITIFQEYPDYRTNIRHLSWPFKMVFDEKNNYKLRPGNEDCLFYYNI